MPVLALLVLVILTLLLLHRYDAVFHQRLVVVKAFKLKLLVNRMLRRWRLGGQVFT